jgi:hypothetical protein
MRAGIEPCHTAINLQDSFIKDVAMARRTELWIIFTVVALVVTSLIAGDKQPAYLGNDHPVNYSEKQKIMKRIDFAINELQEVKKMIEKEGK